MTRKSAEKKRKPLGQLASAVHGFIPLNLLRSCFPGVLTSSRAILSKMRCLSAPQSSSVPYCVWAMDLWTEKKKEEKDSQSSPSNLHMGGREEQCFQS
jgi:hypothetical protein